MYDVFNTYDGEIFSPSYYRVVYDQKIVLACKRHNDFFSARRRGFIRLVRIFESFIVYSVRRVLQIAA